jgi:threonine/homoserine/homoserine lactone efflux protein
VNALPAWVPAWLGIGLAAFVIGFTGAMMPGPLMTVAITETVRRGRRAAIMLLVGHALLEIVFIAAFVLGLREVLGNSAVRVGVSLAGGLFLLWMGYGALRDAFDRRTAIDLAAPAARPLYGPIVDGVLASLSNPYWTLWWVTIGSALVLQALQIGPLGLIAFYIGHEAADFVWYGLLIAAVAGGRRLVTARAYRWILGALGAAVVTLGLFYVVSAARTLSG